jgi:hypothetical protein
VYLLEAKKIGHRTKFDPEQAVRSDFYHGMLGKHHTARIQAKNAYGQTKLTSIILDLKKRLLATLTAHYRGQIGIVSLENSLKRLLREGHESAFLLGVKATGYEGDTLSAADKKWVTQNRYDEHKYLSNFLSDIENSSGKMDHKKRLMLYADSVRGTYNAGRNAYMPSNMLVYWRLESGISPKTGKKVEHCESCTELSKMSPFTTENLPIVPRANHTLCMSNCRCKLIYVSTTASKIDEVTKRLGTAKSILTKLKGLIK